MHIESPAVKKIESKNHSLEQKPINNNHNNQFIEKEKDENYFDTIATMFPECMKYYRLGAPAPDEHAFL